MITMASKLVTPRAVLKFKAHNLRALYLCLCKFSTQSKGYIEGSDDLSTKGSIPTEPWLNIKAGIFGPADHRLPLPGNVGLNSETIDKTGTTKGKISEELKSKNYCLLEDSNLDNINESLSRQMHRIKTESNELECVIQECPKLIMRDVGNLFPDLNLSSHQLSVLTFCQKTVNDMSSWSEKVELEREELMEQFVYSAKKICELLISEGYWADFIDPAAGRPYLGTYTNATMFETDIQYKHIGFTIEDLGCCKVITHKKWGSHIFVGALFTSAPPDCHILHSALMSTNSQSVVP